MEFRPLKKRFACTPQRSAYYRVFIYRLLTEESVNCNNVVFKWYISINIVDEQKCIVIVFFFFSGIIVTRCAMKMVGVGVCKSNFTQELCS